MIVVHFKFWFWPGRLILLFLVEGAGVGALIGLGFVRLTRWRMPAMVAALVLSGLVLWAVNLPLWHGDPLWLERYRWLVAVPGLIGAVLLERWTLPDAVTAAATT